MRVQVEEASVPCQRPERRPAGVPFLVRLAAFALAAGGACRPEPVSAPHAGDGSPGAGEAFPAAPDVAGTLGTVRLTAPDPSRVFAEPDAVPPDEAPSDAAAPAEAAFPPRVEMADELTALLRKAPSPEQERRARRKNAEALKLHRRLELAPAIGAYREALEAWPGHPFSNYNLACAYALQGDRTRAIHHLRVLAVVGGETAEWRLRRARTDADFVSLTGDPEFRQLTGFVPVEVSWSPGSAGEKAATALVRSLAKAQVPAAAGAARAEAAASSIVLHRPGDAAVLRMVEELLEALPMTVETKSDEDLPPERPIVLVLGSRDAARAATGTPEDFVGRALVATPEGAIEHLLLKDTGFLSWERVEDSGRRVTRTGRYHLAKGRLSLDYRQVTESPGPGGESPDVEVEQGRRSTHEVVAAEGALRVDGVEFVPW